MWLMLRCGLITSEEAAIMQVTVKETVGTINDLERLSMMKELLCNVLRYSNKLRDAKTIVSDGVSHTERKSSPTNVCRPRFAAGERLDEKERPNVSVLNW
ncbi:hypothetical protein R3W88_029699 [Solanum pinnatisectum]|uniref:Uncharacterized protein n=1 Tax=Solanum pinnatisectum TaxID=50273 RepID=A0AAV9K6B8_9SOLN|nr:hypothetical protein R3W88_029699 [Solanum pinnatisectum]